MKIRSHKNPGFCMYVCMNRKSMVLGNLNDLTSEMSCFMNYASNNWWSFKLCRIENITINYNNEQVVTNLWLSTFFLFQKKKLELITRSRNNTRIESWILFISDLAFKKYLPLPILTLPIFLLWWLLTTLIMHTYWQTRSLRGAQGRTSTK